MSLPIRIIQWLIYAFAQIVGVCGILLIIDACANVSGYKAELLGNSFQSVVPDVITLVSLTLICLSIYLEKFDRTPPVEISRKFTGPFFAVMSVVLLFLYIRNGGLHKGFINGSALLVFAGGLLRIMGRPANNLFD